MIEMYGAVEQTSSLFRYANGHRDECDMRVGLETGKLVDWRHSDDRYFEKILASRLCRVCSFKSMNSKFDAPVGA